MDECMDGGWGCREQGAKDVKEGQMDAASPVTSEEN